MPPFSQESGILRNYLDTVVQLPWSKSHKTKIDVSKAKQILDQDHYGLEDPKDRILEFLSVKKLNPQKNKGSVLCLVGPPGVGKTSLAKSIARSLGANFVRIALGGVRDEAEIRGHRKTYVGAMPGKLIRSIKKAGTNNPVVLLDEIDKMGIDFQGDPSSALLEVLDPEQNRHFEDHYLEVAFDLSKVFFVTTANNIEDIPYALYDRLEIIALSGYTEWEKLSIAQNYLIPKQIEQTGLSKKISLDFTDVATLEIIKNYTREAGVRDIDRKIEKICRKIARDIVENKNHEPEYKIGVKEVRKYLGVAPFKYDDIHTKSRLGVLTGLAWTELGGDIMEIEAIKMKGKGRLTLTGKLGEVMQESAQAALSYLRAEAKSLKVSPTFLDRYDLHIHVPEGAIPKDGPSAGITIFCSLYSILANKKPLPKVAMTGEMTLTGRVLAIGGLKAKLLAAHRSGVKTVILPEENKKHMDKIPLKVKKGLNFVFVNNVKDVLKAAFK